MGGREKTPDGVDARRRSKQTADQRRYSPFRLDKAEKRRRFCGDIGFFYDFCAVFYDETP